MNSDQRKSLAVAYSYVFGYFDKLVEAEDLTAYLTDTLNWSCIPNLDDVDTGQYGTYPYNAPSIVQFDNGTFHFVDYPEDRTIIDSFDGLSKRMEVYGTPTAWATFALSETPPEPSRKSSKKELQRSYVIPKGKNIWDAARSLKIPVATLIEHNAIDNPHDIAEGYELHLPEPIKKEKEAEVRYEVLSVPIKMHVKVHGGTRKWSFGNARKWKDLSPSGPLIKQNTTVEIYAIAHVPIEGQTAAYYMDNHALGKFEQTGRVNFTLGYNWQDLGEGVYIAPPPTPVPPPVEPPAIAPEPTILDEPALDPNYFEQMQEPMPSEAELDSAIEAAKNGTSYKNTYKLLEQGATAFIAKQSVVVKEHDSRRPNKLLKENQIVAIAGTFEKDGKTYARPAGAVKGGYWYGIPVGVLMEEDDMYTVPLETQKTKSLSRQEQAYAYIQRGASKAVSLPSLFNKKFKVKNKKDL